MPMYKGVCIAQIDNSLVRMPSVNLETLEDCVNYIMLHKGWFHEIIIEDEEEYCILHAVNGNIVYPPQFAGR